MDIERVDLIVKSELFTIVRVFLTALMVKSTLGKMNYFKLFVATTFLAYGGNLVVSILLARPNVLITSEWSLMILLLSCYFVEKDSFTNFIGYNRVFEHVRLFTSCLSSGYAMAHTLLEVRSSPIFEFKNQFAVVPQLVLIIISGGCGGLLYNWFIKGNHFQISGPHIRIISTVSFILMADTQSQYMGGQERFMASLGIYAFVLMESAFSSIKSTKKEITSKVIVEKAQARQSSTPSKVSKSPKKASIEMAAQVDEATPSRESPKMSESAITGGKSPVRTRARSKRVTIK